jgi:hypothetical protein
MPLRTITLSVEAANRMADRLAKKTKKCGLCWEWAGARNAAGYGHLKDGGVSFASHRVAWTVANQRQIPGGLFVCHTCDNPSCVRPDHLWVGTHKENQQDKALKGRSAKNRGGADAKAARTHCPRGHPFDEKNTYWWNGWRHCRACRAARHVARRRVA